MSSSTSPNATDEETSNVGFFSRVWQFVRLRWRDSLLCSVCLLSIVLSVVYRLQPDSLAYLTLIPAFFWFVFGVAIVGCCCQSRSWKRVGFGMALWFVFAVLCVDELSSILRAPPKSFNGIVNPRVDHSLRVLTFNSATGSQASAEEVIRYRPDIVLFQESPSQSSLESVATRLNAGVVVSTPDSSIVSVGQLVAKPIIRPHFVMSQIRLSSGKVIAVISLRLTTPSIDFNFWQPSVWRKHAAIRQEHRQQLRDIRDAVDRLPNNMPVIVGGDFNLPAGDGALSEMSGRLHDSFRLAGVGLGEHDHQQFSCSSR